MSRWSRQPPEQSAAGDDPVAACERTIESVRTKADRNERLARVATTVITLSAALIPVSLIGSTQGNPFLWGKLVPSLLAAIAAAAAGVLQFERPHERWKLYRGYQRALEIERFRYQSGVGPYEIADPDRTLRFAATVANLQSALHHEWSGLLPAGADVAASGSPSRPPGT